MSTVTVAVQQIPGFVAPSLLTSLRDGDRPAEAISSLGLVTAKKLPESFTQIRFAALHRAWSQLAITSRINGLTGRRPTQAFRLGLGVSPCPQ